MTNPAPGPLGSRTFDPFLALPHVRPVKDRATWPLVLIWPATLLLLSLVAAAQGTLGTSADIRPIRDAQAALGIPSIIETPASFPLLRDFGSLFLITVVCWTIPTTHLQWKRMRNALPTLAASGALTAKAAPAYSRGQVLLGIRRAATNGAAATPLESLLASSERILTFLGKSSYVMVILSFMGAILVALGPNRNGIFRAFAGKAPAHGLHWWLATSYESWWASISHPVGFLLYILLMATGFFLVLIQNTVGLLSVWMLLGLDSVADFDLDWLDRDGNYGWLGIARTYHTVIFSLIIHGSALSVTLLVLGPANLPWIMSAVMVFSIMLPSSTIGPLVALRGLSRKAQNRRIGQLIGGMTATTLDAQEAMRLRIQAVRQAKAYPLRVRRGQLPAIFVAVLLPTALTGVQVYFSVKYG